MSLGAGLCLFSPKRPEDMVEAARSWGMEEHSSHLFQSMESRRTWGYHHSDTGDSLGKTVITFHRASCFHVQLLWHCICFCLMEKLLCKTPPEPDDNEYVSLFFLLLHDLSCYNQKLPTVYHVEWLLAILPCIHTLEEHVSSFVLVTYFYSKGTALGRLSQKSS